MSSAQLSRPIMSEQYEELHQFDTRIVEKTIEIISVKEYKLFCTMPSTYTLRVTPAKVTYNELRQISMSNSRLISLEFNLQNKTLVCKSWKNGKERQVSKKRGRYNYTPTLSDVSLDAFNIPDSVHFSDRPQVESILRTLVTSTKLEFNAQIEDKPTKYIIGVELKEKFTKHLLDAIMERTGSFINKIIVDFTNEKLLFHVGRNDCTQNSKKRQRL